MRRDWRLIREVLRWAENDPEARVPKTDAGLYHIDLAHRSGYVAEWSGDEAKAPRLTPAGHDLVDLLRDERVWETVQTAIVALGGMPTDILIEIAKATPVSPLTRDGFGPGSMTQVAAQPSDTAQFVNGLGLKMHPHHREVREGLGFEYFLR